MKLFSLLNANPSDSEPQTEALSTEPDQTIPEKEENPTPVENPPKLLSSEKTQNFKDQAQINSSRNQQEDPEPFDTPVDSLEPTLGKKHSFQPDHQALEFNMSHIPEMERTENPTDFSVTKREPVLQ